MSAAAKPGQGKITQRELNEKFDGLKTILKNIKSPNGKDLYSHLQEVFKVLILHYPDNALEKIEEVSYLVKNADKHKLTDFLKVVDSRNYHDVCAQMKDYIAYMREAFGAKKPVDGEEGGEEEEAGAPEAVCNVPDLLEEAKVWQWAGVGFGQQELYRLQKSLKNLAKDSGANFIRFFGVIRGTEKDYYVAEGDYAGEDGGEEGPERPADFEAKGSGVNKFTYWVSSSTVGKWEMLPDLEPKDIAASRSIKVLFSGNTQRAIHTNPYFFGKEAIYLRAQIARISHSTTLAPKGVFKFVEDSVRDIEPNVPEEGELEMPSTSAMKDPAMWVHENVSILQGCGRTTHMESEPPEGSEIEPEVWMAQIVASDPFDPRLKSITDDKNVVISKNTKTAPWIVRMCGDSTEYLNEAKKTVCNGVVVVRSLQWPGSYNFYNNGRVSQIYVGNGHKYEEKTYYPVHPPTVNEDPDEYEIQPEPTPLEEPASTQDEIIAKVIDEIMNQYDTDGSGKLEKDEAKKFVNDTLSKLGMPTESLTDEMYDEVFNEFDKDGSGTITREEFGDFVKQLIASGAPAEEDE